MKIVPDIQVGGDGGGVISRSRAGVSVRVL
jgi:hypothetical protein